MKGSLAGKSPAKEEKKVESFKPPVPRSVPNELAIAPRPAIKEEKKAESPKKPAEPELVPIAPLASSEPPKTTTKAKAEEAPLAAPENIGKVKNTPQFGHKQPDGEDKFPTLEQPVLDSIFGTDKAKCTICTYCCSTREGQSGAEDDRVPERGPTQPQVHCQVPEGNV